MRIKGSYLQNLEKETGDDVSRKWKLVVNTDDNKRFTRSFEGARDDAKRELAILQREVLSKDLHEETFEERQFNHYIRAGRRNEATNCAHWRELGGEYSVGVRAFDYFMLESLKNPDRTGELFTIIDQSIIPALGDKDLASLTIDDLLEWISSFDDHGEAMLAGEIMAELLNVGVPGACWFETVGQMILRDARELD